MIELDTYPKYLLRNSKLWPDKVALRHKDYGIWQTHTYRTFYQKVESISLGLVSLGLQPGDRVALIGDDESEALWAEVAIPAARGIMVAMWSDSVSSEIEYIVGHSESKFIIAEDQEQVDKILEISGKIPEVQKVVYWDPRGIRGYDDPILMSLESLMRIGSEYKEAHPGIFEALVASGKGDDIAQLTYTSGTTGLPKASEITYSNLIGSAKLMQEFIHVSQGEDLFSTIAQASIFHGWFIGFNFIRGAVINFAE